ncbi:MAG: right-handed parallel beta-helix repeat-containing protein, partial [Candidatus Roizmanbacteria bacterium]|nr:right-handed parallel beta-helix repeat-containing protein [Candidatus Roizmanbacteria bacterium]
VDRAMPGETINLLPGVYQQDIISKRDGTNNAPITITGTRAAIVQGGGESRIVQIHHDYLTLQGFTIDGKYRETHTPDSYRDKLIYAIGTQPQDGVSGLRILNMDLKNAGGECVRLRYFAQNNEIANTSITGCGIHDFSFADGGKNGEGIYIGTAPEQRTDKKNPTADPDESYYNWIHHNTINTKGNECVDIKETSRFNIVEYNDCTGQRDIESGGMDSRGEENIFRHNTIHDNQGAGIRLGGDEDVDGINNQIYNNTIVNNASGGIKIQTWPQGSMICENTMSNNKGGNGVGDYGDRIKPTQSCP